MFYKGSAISGSGGGSGDAVWGSITGTLSDQTDLQNALEAKQDTLVSGTNIKTVNEQSLLGSGNISIDSLPNKNTASGATTPLKLWEGTESEWTNGAATIWYNWKSNLSVDENAMPDSNNWGLVAYGNGKFVAVPGLVYPYVDNVVYSADDGETWTSSSLPTGHTTRWDTIAFGSNNFVTLGYNSNVAAYSSDGSTWTDVTLPETERWTGIAYGGGRFVAVSSQLIMNTSAVYSTNDGTSWTASVSTFNFGNTMCSLVYGNNMFLAIGGINNASNQTAYSTNGGETWTNGTISSSQTWMRAAYGNGKFVAVAKGTDTYAYSSDGITWNEGTLPSSANWMSVTFGNGMFVAVADNNKYAYSSDGENWTEDTFTGTGWNSIAYGNGKFVAITLSTHLAAQLTINPNTYFTSEAEPTTESTVYSAPDTASALTITAVGTGTITLSDTNTYNYNASGNQTITQSIGELYPNYICNIEGVGVKIGTTLIADATGTVPTYSAFTGATSQAAGSAGLVPAPTTSDVDSYLKGDGTWATVSGGGLQNTATGTDSLTILGTPSTNNKTINIGDSSSANAEGAIAIGTYGVYASGAGSIAIGYGYDGIYASGDSSIAIGRDSEAYDIGCISLGNNASSGNSGNANYSIAIGLDARAYANCSIAIGYEAEASSANQLVIGLGEQDLQNNYISYPLLETGGKIPNARINADVTPTQNSTNMITSGAVYTVLGDIETLLAAI